MKLRSHNWRAPTHLEPLRTQESSPAWVLGMTLLMQIWLNAPAGLPSLYNDFKHIQNWRRARITSKIAQSYIKPRSHLCLLNPLTSKNKFKNQSHESSVGNFMLIELSDSSKRPIRVFTFLIVVLHVLSVSKLGCFPTQLLHYPTTSLKYSVSAPNPTYEHP